MPQARLRPGGDIAVLAMALEQLNFQSGFVAAREPMSKWSTFVERALGLGKAEIWGKRPFCH